MKKLVLAASFVSLAFLAEAKTIALWPFGDNQAADGAAVCMRCANNPAFTLSADNAGVDASMPGDWNLPPNPCADLADPYWAIARYSLASTAADGGVSCAVAAISNSQLANHLYPTNDFTVEGWVRFDEFDASISNWRILVQAGNGSGSNGGWCLSMRRNASSGFFYLNIYCKNMANTTYPTVNDKAFYQFIDGSTDVTWDDLKGSWHHYAVAFDYVHPTDSTKSRWRFYFDGRYVGGVNQTRFAEDFVITGVNSRFELGGRTASAGQRLKGAFSYWRVSDEALLPADFLNATNGGTQTGTKVDDVQPTWTALDLNTEGTYRWRWVNTGVRLMGQAISNCTFETWINAANSTWIMSQFSGNNYRSQWRAEKASSSDSSCHLVFQIYDPTTASWVYFTSTGTFPLSAWHHVAFVIDGDHFRFYIDGVLDSEEIHPGLHLAADTTQCDGVVIGSQKLWTTPYDPSGSANASFAEARVWNRARTGDEILSNLHHRLAAAENEPNLIGYWPLCDGVAGESANGLLAYNYAHLDAQATGFYQREVGNTGYSSICGCVTNGLWRSYANLAITGAAPHAVYSAFCPESSYTKAATTDVTGQYDHFTFAGWYFFSVLSATGNERELMGKALAGNGRMHFRERSGGELYVWLGGGDNGATNEQLVVSSANAGLHYGRWTHLAVVRDGNKISIYVDGVLKGESDAFTLPTHPTAPFQFGGFDAGGSNGIFNGLIREVGIWRKALTTEQIVEIMSKRPLSSDRKLLGYWPCDDAAGNSLRNLKDGGNPATPIGGSSAAFNWRSLATVPAFDGTFQFPERGVMLLLR